MSKGTLLILSVLVCLTGCTMIPKYTRPEAPIPGEWPTGPAYQETPATQAAPLGTDLRSASKLCGAPQD